MLPNSSWPGLKLLFIVDVKVDVAFDDATLFAFTLAFVFFALDFLHFSDTYYIKNDI